MRRNATSVAASAVVLAAAGMIAQTVAVSAPAAAVTAQQYTFDNVQIHGGGFVSGIVFNKTKKDLVYARTDIGGAYRWNATTGRWIPLNDWTAPGDWNLLGIDGLATVAALVAGGTWLLAA